MALACSPVNTENLPVKSIRCSQLPTSYYKLFFEICGSIFLRYYRYNYNVQSSFNLTLRKLLYDGCLCVNSFAHLEVICRFALGCLEITKDKKMTGVMNCLMIRQNMFLTFDENPCCLTDEQAQEIIKRNYRGYSIFYLICDKEGNERCGYKHNKVLMFLRNLYFTEMQLHDFDIRHIEFAFLRKRS